MIAPRLSRGLCLLVGLGLLAGACSHKSAATKTPQSPPAESVSPTLTSPTAPSPTPPAGPTPSPTPAPAGSGTRRPAATAPAPAPSTPAAAVSLPRLGTYV